MQREILDTKLLHQVGMLSLSHPALALHGLAWSGRLVEPPVQLLCRVHSA